MDKHNEESAAERFRRFGRAIFAVRKEEIDEVRKHDPPPPMKRGPKARLDASEKRHGDS